MKYVHTKTLFTSSLESEPDLSKSAKAYKIRSTNKTKDKQTYSPKATSSLSSWSAYLRYSKTPF